MFERMLKVKQVLSAVLETNSH